MEDVKLFNNNDDNIEYTANRVTQDNIHNVEYGRYDSTNNQVIESTIVKFSNRQSVEKNWTLFYTTDNEQRFVYKWSPLTICEKQDDELKVVCEIETPYIFKQLLGSTHGIVIGDEIWFLCHLVNYEAHRHYYHMFVTINKETLEIYKYTQLFTFEKEKVEYSLGFSYIKKNNQFLIGYSTNDNTTKYLLVGKDLIDKMAITHCQ
jgi:hypothetical protein